MVKILVIFVCCAALSAWAEDCPAPMTDQLNLTAYAGTWYPVMEMDWTAMNCSFVKYSEVNKTALSVHNSSLGASNDYETVQGEAILGEDKHFTVKMADNYTDNFYVLSTDYGNYTVVMSCDPAKSTMRRAMVLGRERSLSNETREMVEDELKQLQLSKMSAVWQSECPNAAPLATLLPPLGLLVAAVLATRRLL